MAHDIRIIESAEFLRFDAHGHAALAATRELLWDIICAALSSDHQILVDVRRVTGGSVTLEEMRQLAQVCRDILPPREPHKIAILNQPKDDFDRGAWLAEAARTEGWNMRSFRDFEEASEWLITPMPAGAAGT